MKKQPKNFFHGEAERKLRPLPEQVVEKIYIKEDGKYYSFTFCIYNLSYSSGLLQGSYCFRKRLLSKKMSYVAKVSFLPLFLRKWIGHFLPYFSEKRFSLERKIVTEVSQSYQAFVKVQDVSSDFWSNDCRKDIQDKLANANVCVNPRILNIPIATCVKKLRSHVEERNVYSHFNFEETKEILELVK